MSIMTKKNLSLSAAYLQHLKEEHSNVHYFVTGNGNFYSPVPMHSHRVQTALK